MTHLYFVIFDAEELAGEPFNFDCFVEARDIHQAINIWRDANEEAINGLQDYHEDFGDKPPPIMPDDVFLVPTLTGTESLRPWHTVGHVETVLYPHMNNEPESKAP